MWYVLRCYPKFSNERKTRYKQAMALSSCFITDRVSLPNPPSMYVFKGNNTVPTQLDISKAHKNSWSLSKNSDGRRNNECFFSVWLVHVFWLVMLILSEGIIKAVNVLWLYISSSYRSLVHLYMSDDCRIKGPVIITGFIYFDSFMRELVDREIIQAGLYQANTPTNSKMDSRTC